MIDVLEKAGRAGGEVLRKYFQQELTVRHKTSQHNIVTQADIEAQTVIHDTLLAGMIELGYQQEDIGFIGEEEGVNRPSTYTFITDPLDGTNNFASGFDLFGVSIALMEKGEVVAGTLYDPVKDELYIAERGKGAFLIKGKEKTAIKIVRQPLANTLLGGGTSSNPEIRQLLTNLQKRVYPLFRERRILGSAVQEFIFLLKNVFGALICFGPRLWDIAAAAILIEEAGGVLCDWKGKTLTFDLQEPDKPYQFLATHRDNLKPLLQAMQVEG